MTRKEIAETTAEGVAEEVAGLVPGGSTALKVVRRVVSGHFERRATELLTCIAARMGRDDPEGAAAILDQHTGKEWFDEAIARGFRDMMDCSDAELRACMGFLVAEYVVNEKLPDRAYRAVGGLLRRADQAMLPTLEMICETYMELADQKPQGEAVLICTEITSGGQQFWMCSSWGERRKTEVRRVTDGFHDCVNGLLGEGFGSAWSGLSDSAFQGKPLVKLAFDHASPMHVLVRCLRSWRQHRTLRDG